MVAVNFNQPLDEPSFSNFWLRFVAPVPGWLNPWEGYRLYRLAKDRAPRVVAEIGSYQGRSTLCLAAGLAHTGAVLHAVDLFESAYTFADCSSPPAQASQLTNHLRAAGLNSLVRVHTGDSRNRDVAALVPDGLELLFVDGDHEHSSLVDEWALWRPKMAVGATVVFHDYGNDVVGDGVTRLCNGIADSFATTEKCDRFRREPDAQPGGLFIGHGLFPASGVCPP